MVEWNGEERRNHAPLGEAVAALTVHVANLTKQLTAFIDTADDRYVTKDRYQPVERIVYGGVALVLAGFLAVLIAIAWPDGGISL